MLRANGQRLSAEEKPFVLSLSKHERVQIRQPVISGFYSGVPLHHNPHSAIVLTEFLPHQPPHLFAADQAALGLSDVGGAIATSQDRVHRVLDLLRGLVLTER